MQALSQLSYGPVVLISAAPLACPVGECSATCYASGLLEPFHAFTHS
jgi:hypothetical protein